MAAAIRGIISLSICCNPCHPAARVMFNARQRPMCRFTTIQRHFWRYSRDKLCFIAVSSARRCIAACRFPSTTGFAVTIDRRGFVGVIFPLMRSKEFLHHPVYISIFQIEYNRGSSYHRTFSALVSFCSFLPLNIANHKKTGQCRCAATYDTTLYRSIRHTLARYLNTDTPCGCFASKKSGLCYWYDCTIPTLRTNTQTTT